MATSIQLHYFHGRGIGEPIRLIFAYGNVEFSDIRYTPDGYASQTSLKASLPFGQLPALKIDGVFYGQADSLCRLAARISGLYPQNHFDCALTDMVVQYQAEIGGAIAKLSYDGIPGAVGTKLLPDVQRREAIDSWINRNLQNYLTRIESLYKGPYLVGESICWADLCLFNRINQLLDHRPVGLLDSHELLANSFSSIERNDLIASWISGHPEDYPRYS